MQIHGPFQSQELCMGSGGKRCCVFVFIYFNLQDRYFVFPQSRQRVFSALVLIGTLVYLATYSYKGRQPWGGSLPSAWMDEGFL